LQEHVEKKRDGSKTGEKKKNKGRKKT
jgi:hypothetical protein